MMYATHKFVKVCCQSISKLCERTISTSCIACGVFLLFSGVGFFLFSAVNAEDLEVDRAPAAPREDTTEEDVIDGAFYFRLMCWGCHAGETRGTEAPDLFKPQWLYGWTDDGIFQTIFNGLPGTRMQKFGGKLSDEAINMIVGYVRSEQAKAAGVSVEETKPSEEWIPYMEGDVKAGETIFFSDGYACGKCHTVHGRGATGTGGEIGPDLTYIARTRSPQFIVESTLNPRAYIADAYELLTIFTKDGKEITGRKRYLYDHRGRKNDEVVQILDSSGKLWTTYYKKDIRSTSVPQAGVMPENYADILSVKQMHDLLAYLFTLK
ncbi:MAG: c-type cytochrome [Candidatus Poribacteria bacterium]|nr:c-type cytochrome [Candidatus Poribacteria bacterium]